jgi:hypothetical protein
MKTLCIWLVVSRSAFLSFSLIKTLEDRLQHVSDEIGSLETVDKTALELLDKLKRLQKEIVVAHAWTKDQEAIQNLLKVRSAIRFCKTYQVNFVLLPAEFERPAGQLFWTSQGAEQQDEKEVPGIWAIVAKRGCSNGGNYLSIVF